jgi:hypothetical protein
MPMQEPPPGQYAIRSLTTLPARGARTQRVLRQASPAEVQLWLRVCRQLAQNPAAPPAARMAADEHAAACQTLLSS